MIREAVWVVREVLNRAAPGALRPFVRRPDGAAARIYRPPGARNPLRRALSDERLREQTFLPSQHARARIGQVTYPTMRANMDAALGRRNPGVDARRVRRFREPGLL